MEGTSLDEILNGDRSGEPEQAETIGQPRDDHGRFAAKEPGEQAGQETPEQQQEEPPSSEQEPSHIPIAALKDERTKRQQIEAERQQLAERLAQYEAYFQSQQQPQEEEVDPIQLIAQQVMSQLQPQQELQALTMKVELAEHMARQKWTDYDEKVEHFKEAAKSNPFLIQELRGASNPAEYAYTVANKILEAKQYSTAPAHEEIEAQMRAKIMAELGMSSPKAPTTLANERSVGSRTGPAWSGPTPLGGILGR